MTGTGADFTPLALPALDAVLVNPLKLLSTAAVYREFDRMGLGADFRSAPAPVWSDRISTIETIAASNNDLSSPAQALEPAIADIGKAFANDPRALTVSLSGSGATVFALVENAAEAAALAADLAKLHPDWWIAPTRLA